MAEGEGEPAGEEDMLAKFPGADLLSALSVALLTALFLISLLAFNLASGIF